MPTTVVKTIGTGGDYTTLQSWEDACPANLVTVDQVWEGRCKNQEFTSSGSLLSISGTTTDSTRFVRLTTDTGASFRDHANKATNALRYNASNGAAIRKTSNYSGAVDCSVAYTQIIGLQIRADGGSSRVLDLQGTGGLVEFCILEGQSVNNGIFNQYGGGSDGICRNTVVIGLSTGSINCLVNFRGGTSAYNCTFVHAAGTISSTLIQPQYGGSTIYNCLLFANAGIVNSTSHTYTTCLTNQSSPPTGCTNTAFATGSGVQFENITSGTHDFRIKTGSSAKDAGTTNSTHAANDIIGTSRPQGSAYDVGCWEFASSGTTHNVTLTESAAAAETVARVLSAAAALAEAAAAADAGSSQLAAPVALTEPASAADAAAAQLVGFVVVAEAAAVADSATTGSVATGALSEALTPTDAATSTAVFAVSAAETVSAADAASAIAARVAPLAEALSAADTITVTALYAGAVGEALGLADAYATGPVTSATLAEAASLTDAVGVALAAVAAAAESVAAADGVFVVLSTGAAQLEPAALADLVASVRTTLATLGEPAVAGDAVSAADGAVHSAAQAENVSLADFVAALGLVVYVRDRTLVIAADPRTLVIAADPRTFDVRPS